MPEIVAAEMLSVALPVFVSVTVWVELLPTLMLLNATGDGLTVIVACVAEPDPLRLMTSGDPGALLVIDTLPLLFPALVGANVTVKLVVWPGVRLAGAVQPVNVKPVPVMLCAVIETAAVPVFVNVTGTEALAPLITAPKLMLAGFADSAP